MLVLLGAAGACQGASSSAGAPPPLAARAQPTAASASSAASAEPAAGTSPSAPATSAQAEPNAPSAIPPLPPWPDDDRASWQAPERYDHLILKVSFPYQGQYRNVRYEGHNRLLRGELRDGGQVAERWRRLAQGTRGVFLLRDSLWSQQDHPVRATPHAFMMPPCWVTAAVAEVAAGRTIQPLVAPALDDEAAWTAIATAEQMFGSFPPSDSLHREASRAASGDVRSRERTRAARATLRSLASDVDAMIGAASGGIEAVAAAGAERIAASDRRYFGAALRYHRVVPIFVENPNRKEFVDEGKGMTVAGRDIPEHLVELARDAVYLRRLRDGDLAVERYDLSVAAERARAIKVLEALLPQGEASPSTTLWLWVTGRLDPHRKAEGENATRYLASFRRQLEGAAFDRGRLRIVSKPAAEPPTGPGRAQAFRREAQWYRHRDLPWAVRLTSRGLGELSGGR